MAAFAGERFLGRIVSNGADATNCSTITNDAGAGPFYVPRNALITIQCDSPEAFVITDSTSAVTKQNGIRLSQWQVLPTSTSSQLTCTSLLSDGGTNFSGSAIVRFTTADAGADGGCTVWDRRGNE